MVLLLGRQLVIQQVKRVQMVMQKKVEMAQTILSTNFIMAVYIIHVHQLAAAAAAVTLAEAAETAGAIQISPPYCYYGASGGGGSCYTGTLLSSNMRSGYTNFMLPNGTLAMGNSGNGYARITYVP